MSEQEEKKEGETDKTIRRREALKRMASSVLAVGGGALTAGCLGHNPFAPYSSYYSYYYYYYSYYSYYYYSYYSYYYYNYYSNYYASF